MIVLFVEYSVTRWLYCFFNIWSFTTMKIGLQSIKYMKKKVHNFVQYQIVTQEIAKNLKVRVWNLLMAGPHWAAFQGVRREILHYKPNRYELQSPDHSHEQDRTQVDLAYRTGDSARKMRNYELVVQKT